MSRKLQLLIKQILRVIYVVEKKMFTVFETLAKTVSALFPCDKKVNYYFYNTLPNCLNFTKVYGNAYLHGE